MSDWWRLPAPQPNICIVGAGGGIGSATARLLKAQGANLCLMDVDGPALQSLGSELAATVIPLDFRKAESIEGAIARGRAVFAPVHGIVLASGIVDTHKLSTLSVERWNEIIAINLTGAFLVLKAAHDWISDGGRIVTMSSLAARTGGVITGTAYAASKAGIEAMTKSVAQELAGRGILVNCISPGAIDTPMTAGHPAESKAAYDRATPLKRHGSAEEIASTACFLLSAGAGYITGQVIPVNGGFRMD
jgi:NAD(P)-dependent dehydrogenase (short-subunit alcohol dehydrogenase family)